MRLPFRRKALAGTPAAISAMQSGDWNPYPLLGGGARERIQNVFTRAQSANYGWMYRNSPAVRTVIDVILRNVGQLELRLYEEVSESERRPRADHPAALSMRYPNETTSSDKFIREMFLDRLIFDNAYALMTPGMDDTWQMRRIPAYMVEVRGPSLFEASTYRVWPQGAWTGQSMWGGAGTPVDFDASQILHWHGEHPLDPRIGLSRLDTLREVIAEDAALQQATIELAQAGLQEPVWVFRPDTAPQWTNQDRKGFEEDLTNRLHRRNRMPPVMEEGMEIRSFGVSPQDAQMLEVRRWAVQRCATEYGVPLAVVGLGTGRAENLADAQMQLYTDTLLPYGEDFAKMLNQRLLIRVYDWRAGTFEFGFDEKLMGSDRLRALTSASGRAVMLTNEARARLNLPPVAGGDELVTPLNVIVGDNPKPSTDVMPVQQPGGVPQDGSGRQPDQLPGATPPKALASKQLHVTTTPARIGDRARQRRAQDKAAATLLSFYNRQARAVAQKGVKAIDSERWNRELADDLEQTIRSIFEVEGSIYVSRLGGHDFDIGQRANYIAAMAKGIADAVNVTTQNDIEQYGVEDAFNRARNERAQAAGVSIGASATREARYEAADQAPGAATRMKSWVADTDRHAEFDGETVPVGDEFSAGFEPGGAPNCQCSVAVI